MTDYTELLRRLDAATEDGGNDWWPLTEDAAAAIRALELQAQAADARAESFRMMVTEQQRAHALTARRVAELETLIRSRCEQNCDDHLARGRRHTPECLVQEAGIEP